MTTLLLGFMLGIASSVIASFFYAWLTPILPIDRHRPFLAFLKNPGLFIRMLRDGDERRIKKRIKYLFSSWEQKDLNKYLSCWTDNANRFIGTLSTSKEDKAAIAASFEDACRKYAQIHVPNLVVASISLNQERNIAIVEVQYRFSLIRAEDFLPVIEESKEVYSMRNIEGVWFIVSNIDHYYDIRPVAKGKSISAETI